MFFFFNTRVNRVKKYKKTLNRAQHIVPINKQQQK